MFVKPPVLETQRLILRDHHHSEFDAYAALWADPKVTQFIGGKPCSRQQTWTKILAYAGHWTMSGFGYWAVEEKSTQKFIGQVGFLDLKRDLSPSIDGIAEIGWVIDPAVHGKGYASEAVQKILEWSDENFSWNQTACLIHPDNTASIKVADKFQYREACRTTLNGEPIVLFFRNHS